jgi:hypothetical protein
LPDFSATKIVQQIHASGKQLVLAVTGGGSEAIASLLNVPGASRTVLEAVVPYSSAALADWLGGAPDSYCSEQTARAMAGAAMLRGLALGGDAKRLLGVGCTASLASDRPKIGEHRLHVALQTLPETVVASLILTKGLRSRAEEEQLAAALVLKLIAEGCQTADRVPIGLATGETIVWRRQLAPTPWQALWSGAVDRVGAGDFEESPGVLFPGAFNPLHRGHRRMAEFATELLGAMPAFELCIENVDKPPLDYLDVSERLDQFDAADAVWLTRAPLFTGKAELFPGATFLVGADTLLRIAHPRYYGGNVGARDAAIARLAALGARFLVFGRLLGQSGGGASPAKFISLAELDLPASVRALCREVPAELFREDISSTELRRASTPK